MIRFARGEKQLRGETDKTRWERRKTILGSRRKKRFLSGEGWEKSLHSIRHRTDRKFHFKADWRYSTITRYKSFNWIGRKLRVFLKTVIEETKIQKVGIFNVLERLSRFREHFTKGTRLRKRGKVELVNFSYSQTNFNIFIMQTI